MMKKIIEVNQSIKSDNVGDDNIIAVYAEIKIEV